MSNIEIQDEIFDDLTRSEQRGNDNNLPSAKRQKVSENYCFYTDNSFSFTLISSQATSDYYSQDYDIEEEQAWLRLSEQSFAFWNNDEDAAYDEL